jgi:protein-L-isoaspartate O-methyltransferase
MSLATPIHSLPPIDLVRHAVGEASRSTVLLSALGLALRARITGIAHDPDVTSAVTGLLSLHGLAGAVDQSPPDELAPVLALIRAELLFGGHILGDGVGTRGWQDRDPQVMQLFGQVSHGFWRGFERLATAAAPTLLQRLDRPGARFLDIGTGVGWLSIGMLQRWPHLTATGIEPLSGASALAKANLAETGLADRMTLSPGRAEDLAERDAYDLIFVPSAFIPANALPAILGKAQDALRMGGRLLLAVIEPPDQPDAAMLARFRAAVWGGDVLGNTQGRAFLKAAGFGQIDMMQQPGGFIAFLLATPANETR